MKFSSLFLLCTIIYQGDAFGLFLQDARGGLRPREEVEEPSEVEDLQEDAAEVADEEEPESKISRRKEYLQAALLQARQETVDDEAAITVDDEDKPDVDEEELDTAAKTEQEITAEEEDEPNIPADEVIEPVKVSDEPPEVEETTEDLEDVEIEADDFDLEEDYRRRKRIPRRPKRKHTPRPPRRPSTPEPTNEPIKETDEEITTETAELKKEDDLAYILELLKRQNLVSVDTKEEAFSDQEPLSIDEEATTTDGEIEEVEVRGEDDDISSLLRDLPETEDEPVEDEGPVSDSAEPEEKGDEATLDKTDYDMSQLLRAFSEAGADGSINDDEASLNLPEHETKVLDETEDDVRPLLRLRAFARTDELEGEETLDEPRRPDLVEESDDETFLSDIREGEIEQPDAEEDEQKEIKTDRLNLSKFIDLWRAGV